MGLDPSIRNQKRTKFTNFERFLRCAYWLHVLRTDPYQRRLTLKPKADNSFGARNHQKA